MIAQQSSLKSSDPMSQIKLELENHHAQICTLGAVAIEIKKSRSYCSRRKEEKLMNKKAKKLSKMIKTSFCLIH